MVVVVGGGGVARQHVSVRHGRMMQVELMQPEHQAQGQLQREKRVGTSASVAHATSVVSKLAAVDAHAQPWTSRPTTGSLFRAAQAPSERHSLGGAAHSSPTSWACVHLAVLMENEHSSKL